MKMMLEDRANLRDALGVLRVAWLDEIDFSRLEAVKTTFIRRDYRHLASDVAFTAPLISAGRSRRELLIYLLIEHQSEPDRLMPLRLADSQVQIFRYQVRKWLQTHPSAARIRLRPVLPVVFYTGLRHWPQVGTLADLIERGDEFREVTPIVERPMFFNLPAIAPAQLERCWSAKGASSAGCCGCCRSERRVRASSSSYWRVSLPTWTACRRRNSSG